MSRVNIMDERKAKGICVKRHASNYLSVRDDLISKLPDNLLSEMISYLPTTKDIVRTSVLSKRWKSVWLLISRLHLDSSEFPSCNAFVSFMDKFLDFSREHKLGLHSLRLSIHYKDANDHSCVTRWKDFLAMPQLKHLDVESLLGNRECFQVTSLSLNICEKLLYLRLHRVHLGRFVVASSIPCLKTMRLEYCFYPNEAASLESLISSCPVLEDLSILRRFHDNITGLRVQSQTLTRFSINMVGFDKDDDDNDDDKENIRLVIDAPRLKYLSFVDYDYDCKTTIINSGSLTKVSILGKFQVKDDEVARNFFTSISIARDMKISVKAFAFINKFVPLSQFCNLSCLEIELYSFDLKKLLTFLKSFPNLKSLILGLVWFPGKRIRLSSSVPKCLLSSLDFVEVKSRYEEDDFITMEVAKYFVANSVVLKKFILSFSSSLLKKDSTVLSDILAWPKRSTSCKIIVNPLK